MLKITAFFALVLRVATGAVTPPPASLTMEALPPISDALHADAARYLEFRTAAFIGWHPLRHEMLVATRFGEVAQLHSVAMPGGARQQITFEQEPVRNGMWQPKTGQCLLFARDAGGGEFFQIYRMDLDGRTTRLTDGKSRNTGAKWAPSGTRFAFTSTRRNGRDNDIYLQDPADPTSAKLLYKVTGGGWRVSDWSADEKQLLIHEFMSVSESRLHLLDLDSGKMTRLSPEGKKITWNGGRFTRDGAVLTTTDRDGEFHQLVRLDLATLAVKPLLQKALSGDVDDFDLSPDGSTVAFTINEEGSSTLIFADAKSGELLQELRKLQVISGLGWHENGRELGFTTNSISSPPDAWSIAFERGARLQPIRWTQSETGGIATTAFPAPSVIRTESFDGVKISGFLYRPDPQKHPGPRPCLISIHGGPEGQARPGFIGRWNYLLAEMGVAIFYPNVRGSSGFGKTYLSLDNGFKREDSVRDMGAFLAVLKKDAAIDSSRLAVMGGSYGGYMALASLIHYGADFRCGIDNVGVSNFITFLKNTQDYRRDLRRMEYGDERDPAMAAHLAAISPTARAAEIKKPLFIIQGANDPRVPVTEARQMRDAIRAKGGAVAYLEAADEGHGFRKKKNADYLFLTTLAFLKEHMLK